MLNKISLGLVVVFSILFTSLSIASGSGYKEGELLVCFTPKSNGSQRTNDERNQILNSLNAGTVKHSFKIVPGLTLIKLHENLKVNDALIALKGKVEFIYVEPNYKFKLLSTIPNDPCLPYLWGLNNTGQIHPRDFFDGGGFLNGTPDADINAPEAWDLHTNASDIIVAVIDTGIDYTPLT